MGAESSYKGRPVSKETEEKSVAHREKVIDDKLKDYNKGIDKRLTDYSKDDKTVDIHDFGVSKGLDGIDLIRFIEKQGKHEEEVRKDASEIRDEEERSKQPSLPTIKDIPQGQTDEDIGAGLLAGGDGRYKAISEQARGMEAFSTWLAARSKLKGSLESEIYQSFQANYGVIPEQRIREMQSGIRTDDQKIISSERKRVMGEDVPQLALPERESQVASVVAQMAMGMLGDFVQASSSSRSPQQTISSQVVAQSAGIEAEREAQYKNDVKSTLLKNIEYIEAHKKRRLEIMKDMSTAENDIMKTATNIYTQETKKFKDSMDFLEKTYGTESLNLERKESRKLTAKITNANNYAKAQVNARMSMVAVHNVRKSEKEWTSKQMTDKGFTTKNIQTTIGTLNSMGYNASDFVNMTRLMPNYVKDFEAVSLTSAAHAKQVNEIADKIYKEGAEDAGWFRDSPEEGAKAKIDFINSIQMYSANGVLVDPEAFQEYYRLKNADEEGRTMVNKETSNMLIKHENINAAIKAFRSKTTLDTSGISIDNRLNANLMFLLDEYNIDKRNGDVSRISKEQAAEIERKLVDSNMLKTDRYSRSIAVFSASNLYNNVVPNALSFAEKAILKGTGGEEGISSDEALKKRDRFLLVGENK